MRNYTLIGWQDYWKFFDELVEQLLFENKPKIVVELKEAQKHVNGFTDGWHEFEFAFEKAINSNRENLTEQQNQMASFLLTTLNISLTNR